MLPPVLQRELLVRARRGSTIWIRLGIYLLALMLVALLMIPALAMGAMTGMGMASGRIIFEPLRYLLLIYALFEGARSVASAIPDERREGTLGLLFLTNLRSWDVLLGKTASGALSSLYGALVVAPLFALPVLLGGVTGGEVFRSLITLLSGLVLAIGCGTVASAVCRNTLPALLTGIGLAAAFSAGPFIVGMIANQAFGSGLSEVHWSGWLSPFTSTLLGNDAAYYRSPEPFWWSILLQLATAALLAALGSALLARNWRDGSLFTSAGAVIQGAAHKRRPKKEFRQDIQWPSWLAGMSTSPLAETLGDRINLRRWICVLVILQVLKSLPVVLAPIGGGSVVAFLSIPAFLASFAAEIILIYTACRIFSDARQTGEMEILLTSPVTDRELVTTLWHILRNGLFWVFAVMVLQAIGQVSAAVYELTKLSAIRSPIAPVDAFLATAPQAAAGLVGDAFQLVGVVWASMWFGLKSTKPSGAMIKTFVLAVILTGLVKYLIYACLWIPLLSGVFFTKFGNGTPPRWLMSLVGVIPAIIGAVLSVLWTLWARKQLFTKFRQVVTETETRSLWIERLETRLIPPPLPVQPPTAP